MHNNGENTEIDGKTQNNGEIKEKPIGEFAQKLINSSHAERREKVKKFIWERTVSDFGLEEIWYYILFHVWQESNEYWGFVNQLRSKFSIYDVMFNFLKFVFLNKQQKYTNHDIDYEITQDKLRTYIERENSWEASKRVIDTEIIWEQCDEINQVIISGDVSNLKLEDLILAILFELVQGYAISPFCTFALRNWFTIDDINNFFFVPIRFYIESRIVNPEVQIETQKPVTVSDQFLTFPHPLHPKTQVTVKLNPKFLQLKFIPTLLPLT